MSSKEFPHLFSPIKIGNFVVPNRIAMAPTDTSTGNADGSVSQRTITIHEEVAKGGCGFIIVGATTPDKSTGRPTVTCLAADEDPMIPGLANLAEAMHRHGAACAAFAASTPTSSNAAPANARLCMMLFLRSARYGHRPYVDILSDHIRVSTPAQALP